MAVGIQCRKLLGPEMNAYGFRITAPPNYLYNRAVDPDWLHLARLLDPNALFFPHARQDHDGFV